MSSQSPGDSPPEPPPQGLPTGWQVAGPDPAGQQRLTRTLLTREGVCSLKTSLRMGLFGLKAGKCIQAHIGWAHIGIEGSVCGTVDSHSNARAWYGGATPTVECTASEKKDMQVWLRFEGGTGRRISTGVGDCTGCDGPLGGCARHRLLVCCRGGLEGI